MTYSKIKNMLISMACFLFYRANLFTSYIIINQSLDSLLQWKYGLMKNKIKEKWSIVDHRWISQCLQREKRRTESGVSRDVEFVVGRSVRDSDHHHGGAAVIGTRVAVASLHEHAAGSNFPLHIYREKRKTIWNLQITVS